VALASSRAFKYHFLTFPNFFFLFNEARVSYPPASALTVLQNTVLVSLHIETSRTIFASDFVTGVANHVAGPSCQSCSRAVISLRRRIALEFVVGIRPFLDQSLATQDMTLALCIRIFSSALELLCSNLEKRSACSIEFIGSVGAVSESVAAI
jgi:hypothetical protein